MKPSLKMAVFEIQCLGAVYIVYVRKGEGVKKDKNLRTYYVHTAPRNFRLKCPAFLRVVTYSTVCGVLFGIKVYGSVISGGLFGWNTIKRYGEVV